MPVRAAGAYTRDELRLSFLDHRPPSFPSHVPKSTKPNDQSRETRVPRVTSGGGALARSADSSRVAVAGRDSLRVLKLSTPDESGTPRFETSRNYWDGSILKADSAATDVVWARGIFSSKLLTACRNGELVMWDLSKTGSKLERHSRNHLRAIHKLALSPHLPHYCVTGSADGDLRAWDLRDLSRSILRVPCTSGIRSVAFSPDGTHALQLAVGLEDGSIQRLDLRLGSQKAVLDRLPVAHVGPVLSLDWVPASGAPWTTSPTSSLVDSEGPLSAATTPADRDKAGWLASAGMDKTVKIWSASGSGVMPSQPTYNLAVAYPVRRVQFRPGHATELVVTSNADQAIVHEEMVNSPSVKVPCSWEVVQVWDVRRENIPKWVVPTALPDGGISDIAWGDSEVLWAQHASGSFAQLDVNHSPVPLKSANRSTVAWGATGMLSFALDTLQVNEIPFDVEHSPIQDSIFSQAPRKAIGAPPYRPVTQNAGAINVDHGPVDIATSIACANGYVMHSMDRKDICLRNGEIAQDAGHQTAAEAWALAASLLEDIIPASPVAGTVPVAPGLSHSTTAPSSMPNISPPIKKPLARRSATEATPDKILSSQKTAQYLFTSHNGPRRSSPGFTPSPTGSPSPLRKTVALPPLPAFGTVFSSLSQPGSAASTPLRERPHMFGAPVGFDPNARRPSLTPSLLSLTSPRSRSPSERNIAKSSVGQGALDDSSDEEDAAADGGDEHDEGDEDEDDPGTPMRAIAPTRPNPLAHMPRHSWASAASFKDPRDLGESSSDDAFSRTQPLNLGRRPSLRKRKDRDGRPSLEQPISASMRSGLGFGPSVLGTPASAPRLVHQASASSINTVTGNGDEQLLAVSVGTVTGGFVFGRSPNLSGDADADVERYTIASEESEAEDVFAFLSAAERDVIVADEKKTRDMGWLALAENLEAFADEGDVQTAAVLGIVLCSELKLGKQKLLRYVQAYMDSLLRLQLYQAVAYLRKHVGLDEIRLLTTVNTTIYSVCGRCRKPIVSPAPHVESTSGRPGGAFSFCVQCQRFASCAVCHLPVKGLSVNCSLCGHGGHWKCYRQLRSVRPPVDYSGLDPVLDRFGGLDTRTNSGLDRASPPDALLTLTSKRTREGGEASAGSGSSTSTGDGRRSTLVGYPCVTGCGHWCSLGTRNDEPGD